MVGYITKDAGQAHFKARFFNVEEELLDEGKCEHASIMISFWAAGGRKSMSEFQEGDRQVNVDAWSEEIVEQCNKLSIHDDQETQVRAIKYMLDGVKTRSQFIELALNTKLVPILMNILSTPEQDSLHSNCISILGHIASSTSNDHTYAIVEAGCIPLMVSMLTSPASSLSVREQAAWAIGKICEKSIQYRSQIIGEGGLDALIQVATALPVDNTSESIAAGRKVSWALSTFYGRNPTIDVQYLVPMVLVFEHLLEIEDDETKINVCSAIITFVTGPQYDHIDVLTGRKLPLKLIELLATTTSLKVLSTALRAIGEIVTGDDSHTQRLLNAAPVLFFSTLTRLLTHDDVPIRKDTLWIISNISAASKPQVQMLFDKAPAIFPLVLQMMTGPEVEVKDRALWVIHNIATARYLPHKLELLKLENPNVFTALLSMVQSQDPVTQSPGQTIVNNALESILKLLEATKKPELLSVSMARLRSENAEDILEACLEHSDDDTVSFAGNILQTYFQQDG